MVHLFQLISEPKCYLKRILDRMCNSNLCSAWAPVGYLEMIKCLIGRNRHEKENVVLFISLPVNTYQLDVWIISMMIFALNFMNWINNLRS